MAYLSTLVLVACLLGRSLASSHIWKRQTLSNAQANSNSQGSIPDGILTLQNSAYASYSDPNYFSASAYGSNSASGPGASISSNSVANVVTGNQLPSSVEGTSNGQSNGQSSAGTLSNNDNANIYINSNSLSAGASSYITGAGTDILSNSIADSNVQARRKIRPKKIKSKSDLVGPAASASSNSVGSVASGDLNLSNNANGQYSNNYYYYASNNGGSSGPTPPTTTSTTSYYYNTYPSIQVNAGSSNSAAGSSNVISSVSNANGATGVFGSNLGAGASSGNAGSADSGSLSEYHSSSASANPDPLYGSSYANANSQIQGSGTGVQANSNGNVVISARRQRRPLNGQLPKPARKQIVRPPVKVPVKGILPPVRRRQ